MAAGSSMRAAIEQHYFLFGTDPSGRDLLTRTLVAGRVSLAVGIFGGIVSVLIGVVYGGISGWPVVGSTRS